MLASISGSGSDMASCVKVSCSVDWVDLRVSKVWNTHRSVLVLCLDYFQKSREGVWQYDLQCCVPQYIECEFSCVC